MHDDHETGPRVQNPQFMHFRCPECGPKRDACSDQRQDENGTGERPRGSDGEKEEGEAEDEGSETGEPMGVKRSWKGKEDDSQGEE